MFNLGEAILALLEIVFGFWNNQVSLVFELLGQSPTGFKGGGPWGIIEGIEPLFVGIGSALVVLFFVIGFCAESVDIREEIRFEAILRMFIRVAIEMCIRDSPRDYPEIRQELERMNQEINRIGVNINQITHNNNSALYSREDKHRLYVFLKQIKTLVSQVQERL